MKTNKNLLFAFPAVALLLAVSQSVFAHEGHDHSTPGAIPPGLNGGKVVEAEVKGGTHSSDELYFEVVYKSNHASVFPLILQASDLKNFKPLSTSSLKNLQVSGENGRTKKTEKLTPQISPDRIEVDYELKGTSFGFLVISGEHAGAVKTARAQVGKH